MSKKSVLEALEGKKDLLIALNKTVSSVRRNKMPEDNQSEYAVNVTLSDNTQLTQFGNQRYASTLSKLREGDELTFAFKKQKTRTIPGDKIASGIPMDITEYQDFVLLDIVKGEAPAGFEALEDREMVEMAKPRSQRSSTIAPRGEQAAQTEADKDGVVDSAFAQRETE